MILIGSRLSGMKFSNSCDVFTNRVQNFAINSSPITKMIRKYLTVRFHRKIKCRRDRFHVNFHAGEWSWWRPYAVKSILWKTKIRNRLDIFTSLSSISFPNFLLKSKFLKNDSFAWQKFLPISRELLVRKINFRFAISRKRLLDELIQGHSGSKTDKFQNLANKNYLVFAETTHQHK